MAKKFFFMFFIFTTIFFGNFYMRINPVSFNYIGLAKQKQVSFGVTPFKLPALAELNLEKPAEVSYPRIFPYENLSLVLSRPDLLNKHSYKIIAYHISKDIRKAQEEADQYRILAHTFKNRDFADYKRKPNEFLTEENYPNGTPKRQYVDDPNDKDSKFLLWYEDDGTLHHAFKIKNNEVLSAYFLRAYPRVGKKNIVDFREDGTLKEIKIGVKSHEDGTTTADKIYWYNNAGKFLEYGADVALHKNGEMEMKNYTRPNPDNIVFIDKFAAKRTVKPNGEVEYENIIYYDGKDYLKHFPKRTVKQKDEHLPLSKKEIYG